MFKVNKKDTRTTPGVSIVNFDQVNAGWVISPERIPFTTVEKDISPFFIIYPSKASIQYSSI